MFSAYFLNFGWKGDAPGDTWHARRVPGVVSRCGALGLAYSESSREGLSGLGHAGHVAGSGASGEFSRLGTREHVSYSQGFRMWFYGLGTRDRWHSRRQPEEVSRGVLGDRCRIRRLPGRCHSRGSRCTRELPGGLRRTRSFRGHVAHSGASGYYHSGTSGGAGVVGTRGTWPSPKDSEEGSGEGFEGSTR